MPSAIFSTPLRAAPSSTAHALLGIENPLLDICVDADNSDVLAKYKLEANNAILAGPEHAPLYAEISAAPFKPLYVPGGAAQNTIRGAQWLLPKGSTTYIGCVGKDSYADIMTATAREQGVDVHYMVDPSVPTGTCAVLVSSGGKKRSLVANLSAANNYKPTHHRQPAIWSLVEAAQVIYIGGFFLTVSQESIMEIAAHALSTNKWLTFNLSAPFLSQFFQAGMEEASPYWDLLFGNESEAQAFAKAHGWTELVEPKVDVAAIADKIAALPKKNEARPRLVVITQGADSTVVSYKGERKVYPVKKVDPVKVIDTNGAGDAFAAGFLAKLVLGKSIDECVEAGHYVASEVIQRSGVVFPSEAPAI
ncbi:adenosine kinase-like protein [Gonapodya prolifera JEL478]|uniref:Adenosine kinase n=1 Tax=Gonapodya prolifera (strain JEL478) TaxID=1344416 RepID=A0A139AHK7_GONPJ|nr:adenosine kinase-like protein [Gonapodya prolifera JEL478]|eukprot:KXS16296.1 adenosine kinase-like protein [Gonapodya prolifera JEL478]